MARQPWKLVILRIDKATAGAAVGALTADDVSLSHQNPSRHRQLHPDPANQPGPAPTPAQFSAAQKAAQAALAGLAGATVDVRIEMEGHSADAPSRAVGGLGSEIRIRVVELT